GSGVGCGKFVLFTELLACPFPGIEMVYSEKIALEDRNKKSNRVILSPSRACFQILINKEILPRLFASSPWGLFIFLSS
ncbi:MAG: hypothetical protein P8Z37_15490, partial [Acidobacteriota bacterium]